MQLRPLLVVLMVFHLCLPAHAKLSTFGCSHTTGSSSVPMLVNVPDEGVVVAVTGVDYFNNMTCTWQVFSTTDSLSMMFMATDIEQGYDFLRIYNGNSSNAPSLLNATGDTLPSAQNASTNELFLVWTTDSSVSWYGWALLLLPQPIIRVSVSPNTPGGRAGGMLNSTTVMAAAMAEGVQPSTATAL